MCCWRIYYAGPPFVIEGRTQHHWLAAPAAGVQVVVVLSPPPDPRPDRHVTGYVECSRTRPGRTFYTGVDEYDPLGYGAVKRGTLLPDAEYRAIWERAYGDA